MRSCAFSAALFAAVFCAAAPTPVRAHSVSPDTRGFSFHGLLLTSHVGSEDARDDASPGSVFVDEDGVGFALALGYGFTPSFAARLFLSGANHATTRDDVEVTFGSATLEGVYLFRAGQPLRPYLFGGIGGYNLESRQDEFRYETTGPGIALGGGLLFFVSDHFALDAALRAELINWEKQTAEIEGPSGSTVVVETPIEEDGSAGKFLFGAGWWF